jgi:hypothetical protein
MHPLIFPAGVIVLLFAVAWFLVKRSAFAHYSRTTGVITELIERPSHTDDRQDIKFTPKIAFRTAQGAAVDFIPRASMFARMRVGDSLPLLYDPKNPQIAVIDGFFHRHLTEFVLLCLGLASVVPYLIHKFGG